MPTVHVTTPDVYNIVIENGILTSCGNIIKNVTKAQRTLIVSDSNVAPLYLNTVSCSLKAAGFEVSSFVFPAGEQSKTLNTVTDILGAMCENNLTRTDIAVALGGGIVGDLTGFASAIYLRGINFVQIPTSLLAQVDASVGGKTGCDLEYGKNLVGAFHNPKSVLIDPTVLNTLPPRHFADGLSEAVKTAVIKSEGLFNLIKNGGDVCDIIEHCVTIKRNVVENDFKESGERMLLNLGHTLGHAIELYNGFKGITHGEAVAIGTVIITSAAENNGLCEVGTAKEIAGLLKKLNLPTSTDIPLKELISLCTRDKKAWGSSINLVLPKKIGEAFVTNIAIDNLEEFFGL